MTARTHDVAAATALLLAVLVHPPETVRLSTVLLAVLANQLGGIAPDIDQPTAPLWRNLPEGHVMGRVFGRLLGGHRFVSHSLLGLALFGWLAHILLQFLQPLMHSVDSGLVWWAFMFGYASHLVMDTFTKEGVPWLLPLPWRIGFPPLKSLRVTTGKRAETLLVLPVLVVCDVWLCAAQYPALVQILRRIVP